MSTGTLEGPRSAAPVSLQISRDARERHRRRVPAPVERGVGHVGEPVLEAEVVELALAPHRQTEALGPADRVDVPGDPLAARQLPVEGRLREVVGEPVLGPEQHDREVGARLLGCERAGLAGVLEVRGRHPEGGAAVDHVGHVTGERREQLLVDARRRSRRPAGTPRAPRRPRPAPRSRRRRTGRA